MDNESGSKEPFLFLVTVSRDNPAELEKTCRSVALQTEQPDTHLVVDSSGPENQAQMRQIAESVGAHYLWLTPEGVYPAMSKAVAAAPDGSYVWFLNSSDWFAGTQSIETVKSFLRKEFDDNRKPPWVIGQLALYRTRAPWHHWLPTEPNEFVKQLRKGQVGFPHPASVIRQDCLKSVGAFTDNLRVAGDYSAALAVADRFGPPAILAASLSVHVPNGFTSRNKARHAFEKSLARVRQQGPVAWLKEPWRQVRRLVRVSISLPFAGFKVFRGQEPFYPIIDNTHLPLDFSHPRWPVPRSLLDRDEKIYIPLLRRAPGGVETWIRDFREFSKKDTQIVPYEAEQNSAVLSHSGERRRDTRAWRYGNRFIPSVLLIFRDLRAIREINPLIHAHNLQTALLCRFFRPDARLVYFSHNNFGRQLSAQWIPKRWIYFPLEVLILRSAQAVFCLSSQDAERMRRIRPLVFELQGSFNDRFFPITERRRVSGNDVVWVGRFSPVKDPMLALQAFGQFAATEEGHLIMIGDGPLRKKLERFATKSGLQERVIFTGPLSPEKVREIMSTSRVLLVTSKSEGPTPRTIFEGLATGLAVVSTPNGDPGQSVKRLRGGFIAVSPSAIDVSNRLIEAVSGDIRIRHELLRQSTGSYLFRNLFEGAMV